MSRHLAALALLAAAVASPGPGGGSAYAQTADLAGRYRLEGSNPGGGGRYQGEVQVAKTGDTYQVRWQIQGAPAVGTGLLVDGLLSVAFRTAKEQGVAVFRRSGDGGLAGTWTVIGGQQAGTEVWKPLDRM